ncbi:hypothetical protein GCM10025785_09800 [Corynebacterium canis]
MPVPNTRSSSPIPLEMLFDAAGSTSTIGIAGEVGVNAATVTFPGVASSKVPQEPHSGHRPNHFGLEYPHSVQV